MKEWIQFFLSAVNHQARANASKGRAILELYRRLKEQVIELTRSKYAVPLLDRLFAQPVFQISHLEGRKMPTRAMITGLVKQLEDAKILKVLRKGSGRRGQVFVLTELIDVTEGRNLL